MPVASSIYAASESFSCLMVHIWDCSGILFEMVAVVVDVPP